jgi:hypothetical protein
MIPSSQSSAKAVESARRALDEHGRFWLGNVAKVENEFYTLGLITKEERYASVDIALQEICPGDRLGPQPPDDTSSHPPFRGLRLYAFCWASAHFAKRMYVKFALIDGSGPTKLVLYSFHEEKRKS